MSVARPSLASVIASLEAGAEAKQDEIRNGLTKDEKTGNAKNREADGVTVKEETQGQIDAQLYQVAQELDKQINDLLTKSVKSDADKASSIIQNI